MPIGELHRGVQILVGNIGDDALIEVKYGASAGINMGVFARYGVLTIPVTQSNTTVRIIGSGPNVNLVCQLMVDSGKIHMTPCFGPVQ